MTDSSELAEALSRAISQAGSQSALARKIGISQPAIANWVKAGRVLSADHVIKVEEATGVSRFDLRPDLYPRESTDLDRDAA